MGRILDSIGEKVSMATQSFAQNVKQEIKNGSVTKLFIKSTIKKLLIKYLLIFAGIFIVIFTPFGPFFSQLVTSTLFLFVLVWSMISIINAIILYSKPLYYIISERSFRYGIEEFLKNEMTYIFLGYEALKFVGSRYSKSFSGMPDFEVSVKDFLKFGLKYFIVLTAFFVLYFVGVNIILKPYLLSQYAGITTWEIYLFPFVQIKDFVISLFN